MIKIVTILLRNKNKLIILIDKKNYWVNLIVERLWMNIWKLWVREWDPILEEEKTWKK
jgi:hypothetical protein